MAENTVGNRPSYRRFPLYLQQLKRLRELKQERVSTRFFAEVLQLEPVTVRKDFELTGASGGSGVGYRVDELISKIESHLGWDTWTRAILVGAGPLGMALLNYPGFADCRLDICEVFEYRTELIGREIGGRKIRDVRFMLEFVGNSPTKIDLAIICTPGKSAPTVLRELSYRHINCFWNFTDVVLKPPPGVIVRQESLLGGLAELSRRRREQKNERPGS